MPWNARRVVHLHRRTVFGPTWNEVQRDLADTPEVAIGRVLSGNCRADGVVSDFEAMAELIGNSAVESGNADRVKAWWIYRCLFCSNPLQERLTAMWHNHFATSNLKVNSLRQMMVQNQTLRKHASGSFAVLVKAMLRDPALLVWLDAPANRKGHPNENLARELMELFTLGVGHYSENDVMQVARVLTGITVQDDAYKFQASRHDEQPKTIFGTTANFDVDQLTDILLKNPATAKRLAWRLISEFFGESVVSDAARDELVQQLIDTGLDIAAALKTILHSQLFFSDANIASRVSDPLSFVLAPVRAFEMFAVPPSTLLLATWLKRMGLDLFYPSNVGGWAGGRSWLNTRTVIARTNFIAGVVKGELSRPVLTPDLKTLVARHDPPSFNEFMGTLFACNTNGGNSMVDSTLGPEAASVVNLMSHANAYLH